MHARSGTHLRAEISQDQVLNDLGVRHVLSACRVQLTEVVVHSVCCTVPTAIGERDIGTAGEVYILWRRVIGFSLSSTDASEV